MPPKLHELVKLASKCGLEITDEQVKILARINVYNLDGRYDEEETPEISPQDANNLRNNGETIYQWLITQL